MRNVQTELVLLQIAQGLQSLVKNPDLSKSIKAYYELSETEKNQAEEARLLISKAGELRAELQRKEAEIGDVTTLIAQQKAIEKSNKERGEALNKLQGDLERQAEKNEIAAEANRQEAKRLESVAVALSARESRIKKDEEEIVQTRADLKKRADNISKMAMG